MAQNLIGQIILGYLIDRELGSGGFATVYHGYNPDIQAHAAFKILLDHTDPTIEDNFVREGVNLLSLNHTNILTARHLLKWHGDWILITAYAPNGSLRQKINAKSIKDPLVLNRIIMEVASALSYLHDSRRKLIHRDVKPENILFGAYDEAILSDLGLVEASHSTKSIQLQSKEGTAEYVPIEQINGLARAESDQYALAMVCYEVICGEPAYTGPWLSVVANQISPTPVPRLPTSLMPLQNSGAVADVLAQALDKDYSKRFKTTAEFADAFEYALLGSQVLKQQQAKFVKQLPPSTTPKTPSARPPYRGGSTDFQRIWKYMVKHLDNQAIKDLCLQLKEPTNSLTTGPGDPTDYALNFAEWMRRSLKLKDLAIALGWQQLYGPFTLKVLQEIQDAGDDVNELSGILFVKNLANRCKDLSGNPDRATQGISLETIALLALGTKTCLSDSYTLDTLNMVYNQRGDTHSKLIYLLSNIYTDVTMLEAVEREYSQDNPEFVKLFTDLMFERINRQLN